MSDEIIGSVSSQAATNVNISSSDPALVVTEPTNNNFNLDFNEQLAKLPFLKLDYVAGEIISALKVVYVALDGKVYISKSNGSAVESLSIGLALTAAPLNGTTTVVLMGVLQDLTWSWSANELLFLSTTGSITNIPPSTPTDSYNVVLGKALTNNTILVSVEPPITL